MKNATTTAEMKAQWWEPNWKTFAQ